jgi:DUF917 family protein
VPSILERSDVPALARGYELLGSGGGGTTSIYELTARTSPQWPRPLFAVDELDPATPVVAIGMAGSAFLLTERVPGEAPFADLMEAAHRWTGTAAGAVCSIEAAGVNGLAGLSLAPELAFVDADLMGRALPRMDQFSVFVDRLPGLVMVCGTGAGGVVVMETDRPEDVEPVMRTAVVAAGGVTGVLAAGFCVGDLAEHAVVGTNARALELGRAFLRHRQAPWTTLAEHLGGVLLGSGQVRQIEQDAVDPVNSTIEIDGDDGCVCRIIARSESLAFMKDGVVVTASPDVIVMVEQVSRRILQVDELFRLTDLAVISLPGPAWWAQRAHRIERVRPSAYGLDGLDPVAAPPSSVGLTVGDGRG